ncbi:hypothetical protein Tco_1090472 [Tanacetum coccineum]|uniref:Uncharacterized protein n=1 Tax=Tanacetum coccineum TaxID=301880 RepID=A0ABQ5I597_9ASTR
MGGGGSGELFGVGEEGGVVSGGCGEGWVGGLVVKIGLLVVGAGRNGESIGVVCGNGGVGWGGGGVGAGGWGWLLWGGGLED